MNSQDKTKCPTKICYIVSAYIDGQDPDDSSCLKEHLSCSHEFEVREFLFTDDEITDDVERQKESNKVKQLFKTNEVLQPMFRHHAGEKKDAGNYL